MGHGLTALAMGELDRLMIFASGSGVAESRLAADATATTFAAIAAGESVGAVHRRALLILASAHPRLWRPALWLVAGTIIASVVIWVRSPVGYAVLPLVAALLALVAWRAQPGLVRFTLQFLGVLAAMSMLRDFHYLFTEEAMIEGADGAVRYRPDRRSARPAALVLGHGDPAGFGADRGRCAEICALLNTVCARRAKPPPTCCSSDATRTLSEAPDDPTRIENAVYQCSMRLTHRALVKPVRRLSISST